MKQTIFFTGPSIPKRAAKEFSASHILIHTPLIQLTPIAIPKFFWKTLSYRESKQALILTSTFSLSRIPSFFYEKRALQHPFHIFCVGKATELAAKKRLAKINLPILFHRASIESQEGIFSLITTVLRSQKEAPNLIWPCSTKARKLLPTLLIENGYSLDQIQAYYPKPIYTPIQWKKGDTIFFSCPSAVHAFFHFFPRWRENPVQFQAIGEVTQKAIEEHLLFSY